MMDNVNHVLRLVVVQTCLGEVDCMRRQTTEQKLKFDSVANKYERLKKCGNTIFSKFVQTNEAAVSPAEAAAYDFIWPGLADHKLLKAAIGLTMETGLSYTRWHDRVLLVSRYIDTDDVEQSRIELIMDHHVCPPVMCYYNLEDDSDFSFMAIRTIDPQFFSLLIYGNQMHFDYAGEDYVVEWLPV
jgi:hypothetical protein